MTLSGDKAYRACAQIMNYLLLKSKFRTVPVTKLIFYDDFFYFDELILNAAIR